MVISVAVVEDDDATAEVLCKYVEEAFRSRDRRANVERFANGSTFLDRRRQCYFDIVFMDIELPDIDGMRVSEEIRKEDKHMVIVFVTNMAQFAVKGYKVDALDFIIKPVNKNNISIVLGRALERIERREGLKITVKIPNGSIVCMRACDIKYIEVVNHKLIYHTINEEIVTYGQIKNVIGQLEKNGFIQINRFYVVNLEYVHTIDGCTINVDGTPIQMSQRKRREVLAAIADFCGGG